ncbi:hypothetical protein D3C85_1644500 [compost metagenome]
MGEAGPDRITSLILVYPGTEKSTNSRLAGVMVRLEAAISPLPAINAVNNSSLRTGTKTTWTFRCLSAPDFAAAICLFKSFSNRLNKS